MNKLSRSQAVTFTSKVAVSKTVLERNMVKTGHQKEVMHEVYKSGNWDNLGFIYVKVIYRLQSFLNGMIHSCKISTDKLVQVLRSKL